MRLDQWLWFARFFKSRSQAATCCTAHQVTVNGQSVDKDYKIKLGDRIGIPGRQGRRMVRVLAFADRRGPYDEARILYEEEMIFDDSQQDDEAASQSYPIE